MGEVVRLSPVEQKLVNFHGAQIMAVKASDGKVYAGVRWICDGLGLTEGQRKNQILKIQEDAVLSKGGRKIVLPTPGGQQEVLAIAIDYLPLWLAKINANIIEDQAVQEKLIEYQLRAKDVLAAAFMPRVPATIEDLIIMQAESVKALKAEVAQIKERAEIAHHRIDTLDAVNCIGDPQQRLNAMIRKYAHKQGIMFSKAWREFDQAFNTAFRTNLTALRENYCRRNALRDITRPEYLEAVGRLEDAIRVADKMLNNQATAAGGAR